MKKSFLATLFAFVCLGSLIVVPPAGAELSSVPQTSWGVQGLLTGTQTDNVEAHVFALAQAGSNMYVGGRFTEVTDGATATSQVALAAFDVDTGDWVSTFAPVLDGTVYALAVSPDGSRLYVGGEFETVNGVATGGLVALDPVTGAIDATWTGRIGGYNIVRDFDVVGPWLYAGGGFTSVSSSTGGNAAYRTARFDLTTGAHDAGWLPVISGGTVWGIAASSDMDRVYLAGSFLASNGVATPGSFVALEASTPNNATGVLAFETNTQNPDAQYNFDVEVTNGLVFVAGSQHYVQVLNESDLSLEVFHLSSVRGDYQSLTVAGDKVWAGCHCFGGTTLESANGVLWVGPRPDGVVDAPVFHTATNSWLTAFSATTGLHLDGTTPPINTSGEGIWAIAEASDSCLWAGGSVTSTGTTTQFGFTRLCDTSLIDSERPSPPTALTAVVVSVDTIELAWNASTDNFAVVGYFIYDATTDVVIADEPTTTIQLTGLAQADHSFTVRAYDAAGNVSWRSNIQSRTLLDDERPSPPTGLSTASVADFAVDLTWSTSTDNVGVTGYLVFDRSTDLQIDDVVDTSVSYTSLAPGTYGYYVKAYDDAGNISWRSGFSTITVLDPAVDEERPTPPTALVATVPADDTIDLNWGDSSDNFAVTGYEIVNADDDTIITTVPAATATLSGLTFETHRFFVRAYDAAGNTSWRSNIVSVSLTDTNIDSERPSPPTALMASIDDPATISLTWNASTDNVAVVGYQIYDDLTGLVVFDTSDPTIDLLALLAGSHRYYVKAYDAAGNISWRSNIVSFTLL